MKKKFSLWRLFISTTVPKWHIKLFLIFMGIAIVLSAVIFTNIIVSELILREQNSVKLYSFISKKYLDPKSNTDELDYQMTKITPLITFPVIMTDENDDPLTPYESWTLNIKIDSTLKISQQKEVLKKMIREFGYNYKPIIIEEDGKVLNKFYYSHSVLVDRLKMYPYVEILIIGLFIIIGYVAFSNIRRSEESKVWVGMAKEAAHQLGTPLSSMLAWLEILKYSDNNQTAILETVAEMENDVNRLNIIATRFSKIGSLPELQIENLTDTVEKVCQYFEKRLPHLGRKVQLVRNLDGNIVYANINKELFEWVIENLLKNAAEAIENKRGVVKIEIQENSRNVIVNIIDNGKGMTFKQKNQVFFPGFTTKKRGWGLGLSLSKRIVEEYHNGKIYVKESIPNKGTTFTIELKKT